MLGVAIPLSSDQVCFFAALPCSLRLLMEYATKFLIYSCLEDKYFQTVYAKYS